MSLPGGLPSGVSLDSAFWDFSVATYGREGVAAACLSLQDRRGLDVNLLLLCCWAGRCGVRLTTAELRCAVDAVRDWQETVVSALRAARRSAKILAVGDVAGRVQDLRTRIAAVELEAERIEQQMLVAAVPIVPAEAGTAALAVANLAVYAGPAFRPDDAADLRNLLAGTFPDLPPDEASQLVRDCCLRGARPG